MTTLQATMLGIVQGLTEFLPVSSSGHLVLAQSIMGIEPGVTFDLGVHVGTAFAVLAVYGRDVVRIIAGLFRGILRRDGSARLALCLFITSIPAAMVGLLAGDAVESAFASPAFVGGGLILSGFVLWCSDRLMAGSPRRSKRGGSLGCSMSYGQAFGVGVGQALAVFPGVSRSGLTIASGVGVGLERSFAATYSFIASLPVIAGAAVLWPIRNGSGIASADLRFIATGALASFVSGVVAIALLRKLIQQARLRVFAYYLWAVGTATILWTARGLLLGK